MKAGLGNSDRTLRNTRRPLALPNALASVERGLAVFPIPAGSKKPIIKDWPNRCVVDPEIIRRCWPARSNVGIGCKANRLLVVDLDRHDEEADGIESFRQLLQDHGQPWPETFTVSTPSNGVHLYFWAPTGTNFGNTTGKRKSGLAPGIDTRGPGGEKDGGYVVGPTSIWEGRTYDVVKDTPIIVLPNWIAELLDNLTPKWTGEVKPVGSLPKTQDLYVQRALEGEVQNILEIGAGARNDQLNRSAFSLGTLVGAGLLDQADAVTALRAAADAVGLVDDDGARQVDATILSGLRAGIRKPRVIRGSK
ncbi:bifunctional DNA primase/polymerase [Streptosporangium canum]|uniref:bifunctional DNA primase/polymerase n=1 Tax=Streptosporangium canum TaxID=324952 RepID=UPI00378F1323